MTWCVVLLDWEDDATGEPQARPVRVVGPYADHDGAVLDALDVAGGTYDYAVLPLSAVGS